MKNHQSQKKLRFIRNELIFILPIMIAFVFVKFLPFLLTGYYSLTDWNGIRKEINFIGIQNFKDLISDSVYWNSFWFTTKFAAISLVLSNLFGFLIALGLVRAVKGRTLFRAGFYIPNTIGGLVLGFIWRFVFTNLFKRIYQLSGIGFFGLRWLSTPDTAFWGLVIVMVWGQMGYTMLLYIAGLSQLPTDIVEAAKIDGASGFQNLMKVKLPLMVPTITRAVFITFLTCMRLYDMNLALTAGNPYRTSESITMNIFNTAFTSNEMAYGCAKAVIFVIVVVGISALQSYLTSKKEVDL